MDDLEKLRQLIAEMDAGPEKDALEQRFEALQQLPPEQQAEAIKQLSMDYEGRGATLRDDLEKNYAMMSQASPQALDGPSGNPFAYTVAASPLEHIATGAMKYMGGKGIKEDKAKLEELSKAQEGGLSAVMQGALAKKLREDEEKKKLPFWMRQY